MNQFVSGGHANVVTLPIEKNIQTVATGLSFSATKLDIDQLVSQLRRCGDSKALGEGKLTHVLVIKSRFSQDRFLGNLLLQMYGKCLCVNEAREECLCVNEAREVFVKMCETNVFTWNIMISVYIQSGNIEDALGLFWQMPHKDAVSWNMLIMAYTNSGRLQEAVQLFEQAPEKDVFLWNSMIGGYARHGQLETAVRLFENMPTRDVVSWNTIIGAYIQCGKLKEAQKLFEEMPKQNIVSWNTMISGLALHGKLEEAAQLFNKMPKRNVVSWTTMVTAYVQDGQLDKGLELFDQMSERNVATWNAMITGYAQYAKLEETIKFFKKMPERDVISWTAMLSAYTKKGYLKDALAFFKKMPHRNIVSWNVMLGGYVEHGRLEETLDFFQKMRLSNIKPDRATFLNLLEACGHAAALLEGKQVHSLITGSVHESNMAIGNALLNMYSRCGSLNHARSVFNKMCERDVITWNAMIIAYAQHGLSAEVLYLFQRMQKEGVRPDEFTFVGLLSACSYGGLMDEGAHFLVSMGKDPGVTPTLEHYTCRIDFLGRIGCLDEAEDLITSTPFREDTAVWTTFLGSCTFYIDMKRGRNAADCVLKLDPANAAAYVSLSNIYAAAGLN